MTPKKDSQITLSIVFFVGVVILWLFSVKIFLGFLLLTIIYMFYSTAETLRQGLNVSHVQTSTKLRAIMKKVGVTQDDLKEAYKEVDQKSTPATRAQFEEDIQNVITNSQ